MTHCFLNSIYQLRFQQRHHHHMYTYRLLFLSSSLFKALNKGLNTSFFLSLSSLFQPSSLSSLTYKPKLELTEHLPRRTYPSICNVCNSPLMPCALRICKSTHEKEILTFNSIHIKECSRKITSKTISNGRALRSDPQ